MKHTLNQTEITVIALDFLQSVNDGYRTEKRENETFKEYLEETFLFTQNYLKTKLTKNTIKKIKNTIDKYAY